MSLRLFVPGPLVAGQIVDLPEASARHVQVRRAQPGDALVLFDGSGPEWPAQVLTMGRRDVTVRLGEPVAANRELHAPVHLAVGMPANERMDTLVEKATELGASTLVPLICERSVLRLDGERAERRRQHWQAVAQAAAEQSGRSLMLEVLPVQPIQTWLHAIGLEEHGQQRWLLSLHADAASLRPSGRPSSAGTAGGPGADSHWVLSGPEGGLSPGEQALALAWGFVPRSLGPRVLRADTAPLAAVVILGSPGLG